MKLIRVEKNRNSKAIVVRGECVICQVARLDLRSYKGFVSKNNL